MSDVLNVPPTEAEKAEVLNRVSRFIGAKQALVLRRAFFQLDSLKSGMVGGAAPAQGEGTIFTDSPGTMEITRSPVVLAATSAGAAPEIHVGHCVCAECQAIDAQDKGAAQEASAEDACRYIEANYADEPMMREFVAAIRREAWGPLAAHGAGRPQRTP